MTSQQNSRKVSKQNGRQQTYDVLNVVLRALRPKQLSSIRQDLVDVELRQSQQTGHQYSYVFFPFYKTLYHS